MPASVREAMIAVGDFTLGRGDAERDRVLLTLVLRLAQCAQRTRMIGTSAVDLVLVADGGFDASVTLANRSWDMAAGVAIAREAGARVTDLDGSTHTMGSRTTIAATPGLHQELLGLVRDAAEGSRYDPATWATAVTESH
jgi:myo-inositol-1(or 4)-monophosphatase